MDNLFHTLKCYFSCLIVLFLPQIQNACEPATSTWYLYPDSLQSLWPLTQCDPVTVSTGLQGNTFCTGISFKHGGQREEWYRGMGREFFTTRSKYFGNAMLHLLCKWMTTWTDLRGWGRGRTVWRTVCIQSGNMWQRIVELQLSCVQLLCLCSHNSCYQTIGAFTLNSSRNSLLIKQLISLPGHVTGCIHTWNRNSEVADSGAFKHGIYKR